MEHFQFRSLELGAHLVDFFDAYPMLASDRSPGLDAHLQYLAPEFLRQGQFSRLVGVIKNQRMQIPVPA